MSQINAVLERIDRDLDASLDRLFALLRIQSVSTDPAYKDFCRAAADHVAADLRTIGFATEVRRAFAIFAGLVTRAESFAAFVSRTTASDGGSVSWSMTA